MSKYMTKQRKILTEYLSHHTDESISAGEIADALSDKISKSAVYRNLADMEAEGYVRRVVSSNSREVIYQYIDRQKCTSCLHLLCTKCGKTVHMEHSAVERLTKSLSDNDDFALNVSETVLYGTCHDCK